MPKTHGERTVELQDAFQRITMVLLDLHMSEESNPFAVKALQGIWNQLEAYLQDYRNALAEGAAEEGCRDQNKESEGDV